MNDQPCSNIASKAPSKTITQGNYITKKIAKVITSHFLDCLLPFIHDFRGKLTLENIPSYFKISEQGWFLGLCTLLLKLISQALVPDNRTYWGQTSTKGLTMDQHLRWLGFFRNTSPTYAAEVWENLKTLKSNCNQDFLQQESDGELLGWYTCHSVQVSNWCNAKR